MIGWVVAFEAQKCRGASTQWIASGASLPLQIPSIWEFDWSRVGEVAVARELLQSTAFLPDVPPPRA